MKMIRDALPFAHQTKVLVRDSTKWHDTVVLGYYRSMCKENDVRQYAVLDDTIWQVTTDTSIRYVFEEIRDSVEKTLFCAECLAEKGESCLGKVCDYRENTGILKTMLHECPNCLADKKVPCTQEFSCPERYLSVFGINP